jgi:hypothetical protein
MLKIEATHETPGAITIALSGTIGGEYLLQLGEIARQAAAARRRLSIDLSQVRLVDREAVRFLACAVEQGVRLVACPSWLQEWLRSEARDGNRHEQAGSPSYSSHKDSL